MVIPAIAKHLRSYFPSIATIVDLGCGDGYTLKGILEHIPHLNDNIKIGLVDRSVSQLNIAEDRLGSRYPTVLNCDLNSGKWLPLVRNYAKSRLLLSIFVLQEVAALGEFLHLVKTSLDHSDIFVAIVVDPEYAVALSHSHNKMIKMSRNGFKGKDWEWASVYPVATNSHITYLPYFHRTRKDYRRLFDKNGLSLDTIEALSVPHTPEAHRVFHGTVYAETIFNMSSSLLLIASRKKRYFTASH